MNMRFFVSRNISKTGFAFVKSLQYDYLFYPTDDTKLYAYSNRPNRLFGSTNSIQGILGLVVTGRIKFRSTQLNKKDNRGYSTSGLLPQLFNSHKFNIHS
jgi:hypothetical protein